MTWQEQQNELRRTGRLKPSQEAKRPCIGCGKAEVRGRTYCPKCKVRLARGIPLDVDEVPTWTDSKRVGGKASLADINPGAFR